MSTPGTSAPLHAPNPDALLAWVIQNPQEVAAYLAAVRALRGLEIVVTQNGVTKKFPVMLSGENAVVSVSL